MMEQFTIYINFIFNFLFYYKLHEINIKNYNFCYNLKFERKTLFYQFLIAEKTD